MLLYYKRNPRSMNISPPKIKYLTNKDLLREIHLSKNTYCSYLAPEYSEYDLIVPNVSKINIRTIAEAKRNRASKMSKQAHEQAQVALHDDEIGNPTGHGRAADSSLTEAVYQDAYAYNERPEASFVHPSPEAPS